MIVAGFGFSTRASTESLKDALMLAHGDQPLDALATLADKASALGPLAAAMGVAVIGITGALPETPTQSAQSLKTRGTGSVAEACALAAAGSGAYLRRTRVTSRDRLATCAIAQGETE